MNVDSSKEYDGKGYLGMVESPIKESSFNPLKKKTLSERAE